jgi:hypothetical protein
MSDLLQRIHHAQIQAGEDVVVDDLRRKRLLPPKSALVGTLPAVEALIREYVEHLAPRDRLHCQLTFSAMLIWARKKLEAERRETTNATDTR